MLVVVLAGVVLAAAGCYQQDPEETALGEVSTSSQDAATAFAADARDGALTDQEVSEDMHQHQGVWWTVRRPEGRVEVTARFGAPVARASGNGGDVQRCFLLRLPLPFPTGAQVDVRELGQCPPGSENQIRGISLPPRTRGTRSP